MSVIDTTTNTVVATVGVGNTPGDVAISPDGTRAYVTNRNSNIVSIIDTTTNTVVGTVAVGTGPEGVATPLPPDTAPPRCFVSGLFRGPPAQQQVTVQDTGSGLAEIFDIVVVNGTVTVEPFSPGTRAPIRVTATKTDQTQRTSWHFKVRDQAGNVKHCI